MPEYIERDYLLSKTIFHGEPIGDYNIGMKMAFDCFHSVVNEAPAADVARVVRCKDCCYWNRKYTTVGECEKLADRDQEGGAQFDCDMDNDDFCSYGKRKETT